MICEKNVTANEEVKIENEVKIKELKTKVIVSYYSSRCYYSFIGKYMNKKARYKNLA